VYRSCSLFKRKEKLKNPNQLFIIHTPHQNRCCLLKTVLNKPKHSAED